MFGYLPCSHRSSPSLAHRCDCGSGCVRERDSHSLRARCDVAGSLSSTLAQTPNVMLLAAPRRRVTCLDSSVHGLRSLCSCVMVTTAYRTAISGGADERMQEGSLVTPQHIVFHPGSLTHHCVCVHCSGACPWGPTGAIASTRDSTCSSSNSTSPLSRPSVCLVVTSVLVTRVLIVLI